MSLIFRLVKDWAIIYNNPVWWNIWVYSFNLSNDEHLSNMQRPSEAQLPPSGAQALHSFIIKFIAGETSQHTDKEGEIRCSHEWVVFDEWSFGGLSEIGCGSNVGTSIMVLFMYWFSITNLNLKVYYRSSDNLPQKQAALYKGDLGLTKKTKMGNLSSRPVVHLWWLQFATTDEERST